MSLPCGTIPSPPCPSADIGAVLEEESIAKASVCTQQQHPEKAICVLQVRPLTNPLQGKASFTPGDALLSCHRHYRSRPTHGIGRFKYLLPKEAPKRKKDRVQMKEINAGTDYEYGDINIQMTSYDMCLVEHFAQYVHKLCNRLSIRVNESKAPAFCQCLSCKESPSLAKALTCGSCSYAMPTKTNEVLFLEERGSKLQLDAVLTTHQRVVQISHLSSTFAPILLEIIQSNQPEGVHLLVKEHTEADFKSRLKARPELEELKAQMN
ncbi:39S ribosomal protein L48, mitochondrial isoform X2 [Strigops habroptila]|uniref:39S ribosomal protein L48, mitochondrial isoform X2 n=1 Tax=Strigops habroptila TaxID=2489341 RepID=UPI0011D00F4E|nr:39S ribosomal protein L48, mitochondrial isoform X2 [Strigops habroptila]